MKKHYLANYHFACLKTGTVFYISILLSTTAISQQSGFNSRPTIASIEDRIVSSTPDTRYITLSGISAGTELDQTTNISVETSNTDLLESLEVFYTSNGEGAVQYRVRNDAHGTANIAVTVTDDGHPSASITRHFTITVEPVSKKIPSNTETIASAQNIKETKLAIATYPNPAGSSTQVSYLTQKNEKYVSVDLFDPVGVHISNIYSGPTDGGRVYRKTLVLSRLDGGVYLLKLSTGNSSEITRIVVTK